MKILILPKFIYRFNEISIKSQWNFLYRQNYSIIYMEDKETKIVESNFEERELIGRKYFM